MARTGTCKTCGKKIRPSADNMSVGAASRIHYWKYHPEVMLAGQAERRWKDKPKKKARR